MTAPSPAIPELPAHRDWAEDPSGHWARIDRATEGLGAPLAVLDLDALAHNAADMTARAAGTPIRIASKSLRVRSALDAVLARPGFRGVLAYTLPEALWLASESGGHPAIDDVVVGYPSVDRAAIAALAADEVAASRITLMVDSVEQLELVDRVVPPARRPALRIAIELDAAFEAAAVGHVGVWRSPIRTPVDAVRLARHVESRAGFRLVGLMCYEAQIAGQIDRIPGRPLFERVVRRLQAASRRELRERRASVVSAVREVADLEFVNGGGTGSLEYTSADPSVTEIGAGSGLFGGHLFDGYRAFRPAPAAAFALDVVRRPAPGRVAVLGGGWIASGPPSADRLPLPVWPAGLTMAPREAAGEVQTPLSGRAADRLRPGDRVWFRHTKSGELAEHVDGVELVRGESVLGRWASYRGDGKAFL